jgi:hypothetical protein
MIFYKDVVQVRFLFPALFTYQKTERGARMLRVLQRFRRLFLLALSAGTQMNLPQSPSLATGQVSLLSFNPLPKYHAG